MIILSALGTGNYREANYRSELHPETMTTGLFAVALHQWYPEAQVKILATQAAQSSENGHYVRQNFPQFELVDIPEGRTEAEAWALFEKITGPEVVPQGAEVIFDITHSLRSLPMLGFLALSYLKVVRHVTIKRVYYGALDLTPREGDFRLTPVLDLTPLVALLDWAQAARRFQDTGDASLFKPLLTMQRAADYNAVSRQLDSLSRNIAVNRGLNIPQEAEKMLRVLKTAEQGQLEAHQTPFALVLRQLEAQVRPLAAPQNDDQLTLQAQYALTRWYAGRGHHPQAMALAREWLISVRQWHKLGRISMDETERETINDDCKAAARALQSGSRAEWEQLGACLLEYARVCLDINSLRNDLMHFGFKPQMTGASQMRQRVEDVLNRVPAAVRPLGLELEPATPPEATP
jgi:CRISPR-associated DxTHG motif protein